MPHGQSRVCGAMTRESSMDRYGVGQCSAAGHSPPLPHVCPTPPYPDSMPNDDLSGVEATFAGLWACVACHGPAVSDGATVTCVDDECGVVRILPALPERLPWEPER